MKTIELSVEKRGSIGKNEARRQRASGRIPGVVYGAGKPTVPISLDRKALSDLFRHGAGENTIFLLKLVGSDQSRHAMIREFQRDPASRKPLHVDFVRVLMDTKIRVKVGIEVIGSAKGVRTEGGILDFVTREVEIECLPGDIPAQIPIDVSELSIGDALRISQIPVMKGVQVVDDPEKVLVHVTHPTAEKAPEVVAAEAATEITEPEVLKKGKVATEEAPEEKEKEKEREKEKKEK